MFRRPHETDKSITMSKYIFQIPLYHRLDTLMAFLLRPYSSAMYLELYLIAHRTIVSFCRGTTCQFKVSMEKFEGRI